ncbi:MAG: hypothetical protein H0X45_12875 [Planctomycetes bacterium]|nr:hypothetical protein [Planctomycetota bacterium]
MRPFLIVVLAALAISSTGCGGARFMARDDGAPRSPPAGKALVNFIRPSSWASGETVPIFDGARLVGNVQGTMIFPHVCEPGAHWFFADQGRVSAVHADLLADKTYDILVDAEAGTWNSDVLLHPVTPDFERRGRIAEWDATLPRHVFAPDDEATRYEGKRSAAMAAIQAGLSGGGEDDRVKKLEKTDHR